MLLVLPLLLFSAKEGFYAETWIGAIYALAIYVLSFTSGWTQRTFASSAARKIGQASFSIYLMHVLVIYWGSQILGVQPTAFGVQWAVLGVLAVGLPMLISHYVEMPLQKATRHQLERMFGFAGTRSRLSPSIA